MIMKIYDIFPIFMIIIAEILLFSGYRMASIAVHSINILMIIGIMILKKDIKLIQAVSLISLLRIVNTSMPVFFSFTLYWFVSLYAIMYIPIIITLIDQNLNLKDIGITTEKLYLIPVGIILGFGLASLEYSILKPQALIPDMSFYEIFKLGIAMVIFIGLVEEFIFRVFFQRRLEEKIGLTKGLLLASIVFGFMHSGYSNYYEMLFASFAGLVLGFSYQKTRNLSFITITHGFNNIFLFGILPFLLH